VGIATLDQGRRREVDLGHLRGRWTFVGDAAGCEKAGVRRIELPAGGWSTPAHEHGREEEIFYVLAGRGLSWQAGAVADIGAGDCIVYLAGAGAHTLHALEPLDVLAFGLREDDESVGFPRLGMSYVGGRMVESIPGMTGGAPTQFVRESELGPPPLPPSGAGPRPTTIVNVEDVEAVTMERTHVARTRRNLGRAAGSLATGLQHVTVVPGKESAPPHCHSLEEEIFVILDGDGVVVLADEETAVKPGHVIARPAGTGIAHVFRAGTGGLTYLAYGMRDPGDLCYYPRSGKIAFRGLGVIARVERLDYWDGED
jgi:uncharacterized cupin superfamily protein